MKLRYIFFTLIISGLWACQENATSAGDNETPSKVNLKESLPGAWQSVSFEVTIHSADNEDTTMIFSVDEANWAKKLGTPPVQTSFYGDNKYKRVFRSAGDLPSDTLQGIWNTFGDTLMLIEANATYQYEVLIQPNGLAKFKSMMDWDGDGYEDDEYIGVERKVSKTPF